MMTSLRNASRRGVPIVAINPLRERALERFAAPQDPIEMATFSSTPIASEYCQVRVGGDVAVLKGIMKLVLEAHEAAIARGRSAGARSAVHRAAHARLRGARRGPAAHVLGRHSARLGPAARADRTHRAHLYRRPKSVHHLLSAWASPSTAAAPQNVQQIANLLLMRGNFGRPGAGICPVRGHSNVQGDRTVGIDEKPKRGIARRRSRRCSASSRRSIMATRWWTRVQAMIDGRAEVFVGLGGNFVAAVPDTEIAARRRCGG